MLYECAKFLPRIFRERMCGPERPKNKKWLKEQSNGAGAIAI